MDNQEVEKPSKRRRTRKANMWAKAAGEYYRSHKNDPNIKEFRDVLKSPDFKKYYLSKYGKGKSSQSSSTRSNKKLSKNQKKHMGEEIKNEEPEMDKMESGKMENEEMESVKMENEEPEMEKVKIEKKIKNRKAMKEIVNGGNFIKK
jgi:hypothetical protein